MFGKLPTEVLVVMVNSVFFNKHGKRMIKFRGWGKIDVRTSHQVTPWGIDCHPVKGVRGINTTTQKEGATKILGYVHDHPITEVGEVRLFATNAEDEEQCSLHLKNTGNIEINGNARHAVAYEEMAATVNELKSKVQELQGIISSWTPDPNDGGLALKTAATAWATAPMTQDIAQSKVDTVKLP